MAEPPIPPVEEGTQEKPQSKPEAVNETSTPAQQPSIQESLPVEPNAGEATGADGYPNLYADLGLELWLHPLTKDYGTKFLKSAKEYGFLDRVLFGSDQMVWPEAITSSIDFLNAMDFLTKAEKEMILYKNAKKFLGIKE